MNSKYHGTTLQQHVILVHVRRALFSIGYVPWIQKVSSQVTVTKHFCNCTQNLMCQLRRAAVRANAELYLCDWAFSHLPLIMENGGMFVCLTYSVGVQQPSFEI